MWMFARLIGAGDHVVEVGAHVGFMTVYFAQLVGPGGRVTVFEPGPNNLPYLRTNAGGLQNVTIRSEAVSDETGTADFYVEDLTGQNNSLLPEYRHLADNQQSAHVTAQVTTITVPTVRLDDIGELAEMAFLKIDVEGAELAVLRGAFGVLEASLPALMVEVTENHAEVAALLTGLGYRLLAPDGSVAPEGLSGNVFALHPERHARQLVGITRATE